MSDLTALAPVEVVEFVTLPPVEWNQFSVLPPVIVEQIAGQVGLWTGEGPPGTIIGAHPNDEYLDTISGDLYKLT